MKPTHYFISCSLEFYFRTCAGAGQLTISFVFCKVTQEQTTIAEMVKQKCDEAIGSYLTRHQHRQWVVGCSALHGDATGMGINALLDHYSRNMIATNQTAIVKFARMSNCCWTLPLISAATPPRMSVGVLMRNIKGAAMSGAMRMPSGIRPM